MTQPLATAKYVAAYLGSPVHFILQFDRIPKTEAFAALAGLVLIACALWYAIQTFRQPRPDSARLALLTFILYIVASALVTAGGRVVFGWEQAVSSRYTTLAIAAWAALLVLAAPAIEKHVRKRGTGVFWGFVALAVVMFPLQMSTLRPDYRQLFERNVAGLALEMGAHDDAQTNVLLPQPGPLWQIAEPAIAENLSVFGTKPLGGLRERIGSAHVTSRVTLYRGALETATPVPGTRFLRVGGWMIDSAGHPPATISIVDESGRLVGFALTGDPRKDLRARFTSNAYFAGFKGYVLADMAGKPVVFVTDNGAGQFSAVVAP
jgi:hypothetical protein